MPRLIGSAPRRPGGAFGLREIEVIEIRESRAQDAERRRVEELIAIANVIPDGAVVIVLDQRGENLDSAALAGLLRSGGRRIARRLLSSSAAPTASRQALRTRQVPDRLRSSDLAASARAHHAARAALPRRHDPCGTSLPSRLSSTFLILNPASPICDGVGAGCVLIWSHGAGSVLSSRAWRLPLDTMILRRSRRSDPRLVLGPVLALVLPCAGANPAALAQVRPPGAGASARPPGTGPSCAAAARHRPGSPPTDAEAIKQRDQELDAIARRERVSAENQAKLQARDRDDRRRSPHAQPATDRYRRARARCRSKHRRDTQDGSNRSTRRRRSAQIARRTPRARSWKFSAALQRVGHQPPPALMVQPEDALQAVRTAITLGAVLPEMRSPGRCDFAATSPTSCRCARRLSPRRDHLAHDLD